MSTKRIENQGGCLPIMNISWRNFYKIKLSLKKVHFQSLKNGIFMLLITG
jgi:hypothetical protein